MARLYINCASFHFIRNGRLITESSAIGSILREYIYFDDEPLALVESGSAYYFANDHLGSSQALFDQNGETVWQASYDPFGAATISPDSTLVNHLRLPGQYFDSETGLHYNWHRYYEPGLGRYLTPDPIGLDGGINLYAYVGGNPVNYVDPFGERIRLEGTDFHKIKMLEYLSKYLQANVTISKDGFVNPVSDVPAKLECFAQQFSLAVEDERLLIIRFATPSELLAHVAMRFESGEGELQSLMLINFRLKHNENAYLNEAGNRFAHVGEMFAHEFTHVEDWLLGRPQLTMKHKVGWEWRAYDNMDKYTKIMGLNIK